jgi:hypothetical protein
MNLLRRRALPACVLLFAVSFAPDASAEMSKAQCAAADTQAQQLRRDEKLSQARAQLKLCVDPTCPQLVRDDCAQRLDELDKVQPTLVFEVKDSQGRDMTEVKVTLDGQPLVDNVSGAAIPVEPGAHSFTFETQGEEPVTRQLVLREGDKARHEKIAFGSGAPAPPPPPADPNRGSTQRAAGIAIGVIGLVGIGIGALFGELASSKWSSAQSACMTTLSCTPNGNQTANGDRTNALTLATVSTVSFVAGGVLAAGGFTLLLTAPSASKEARPAQGLQLAPTGGPGGAGVTLRGWF